MSKENP